MRPITDLTINQSGPVSHEPGHRARVGEEVADVLLYLLRLADELGIDVMEAARQPASPAPPPLRRCPARPPAATGRAARRRPPRPPAPGARARGRRARTG